MPVAKSYQNLELVGEPFAQKDKMYVIVKTAAGTEKQVRWYTDSEFARLYPAVKTAANAKFIGVDGLDHSKDPYFKTQKHVLGFTEGYITIFKGDTYNCKDWFKENGATYRKFWGWSFPGGVEIPELPAGVEAMRLNWELVGDDATEKLLNDDAVAKAVDSLTYEDDGSEFVGDIGDKLELYLTIDKIVALDGYYGPSNMYIMHDDCGNNFIWTTAPKDWMGGEGSEVALKGTVKDHKLYRNSKQTVLTRCRAC